MRGVQGVQVNTQSREAVVTRRSTQARDPELLQALQRTGYPGRILPTSQATLRVQGLDRSGSSNKARASLLRVRGVRNVEIQGTYGARVTYDPRKVKPKDLTRALRRAGLQSQIQG